MKSGRFVFESWTAGDGLQSDCTQSATFLPVGIGDLGFDSIDAAQDCLGLCVDRSGCLFFALQFTFALASVSLFVLLPPYLLRIRSFGSPYISFWLLFPPFLAVHGLLLLVLLAALPYHPPYSVSLSLCC